MTTSTDLAPLGIAFNAACKIRPNLSFSLSYSRRHDWSISIDDDVNGKEENLILVHSGSCAGVICETIHQLTTLEEDLSVLAIRKYYCNLAYRLDKTPHGGRKKLIAQAAVDRGCSKQQIYRMLTKYTGWKSGRKSRTQEK